MKKIIFGCIALLSTASFGASIDALSNSTPAYLGNPAQNATMTAEAAFYNPAGLTELEDGNYISGGLQMAYTKFGLVTDEKTYTGRDPKGAVPNLSFVHKSGDFAYYLNTGGAAGGAEINYKDGVPLIDSLTQNIANNAAGPGGTVTGKNAYVMVNAGTAYKVNKQISIAAGLKYIYAQRNIDISVNDGGYLGGKNGATLTAGQLSQASPAYKAAFLKEKLSEMSTAEKTALLQGSNFTSEQAAIGYLSNDANKAAFQKTVTTVLTKQGVGSPVDGSISSKRTAQGLGGTFGINYKPTEKWNMALNYNTRVKLNFKTKTEYNGNLGTAFPTIAANPSASALAPLIDGTKQRRDLPAELKYGTAYKLTDRLTVMSGANYYFLKEARTDGKTGFKDGWEINVGAEYQLTEKLTLTGGYNYAHTGAEKSTFSEVDTPLNSNIFTLGLKYQQTPNLQWTLGGMFVHYMSMEVTGEESGRTTNLSKSTPENVTYKKDLIATGLGLTYKF